MQNNVVYGIKKLHHIFNGPRDAVHVTVHHNPNSSAIIHKRADLDFIRNRRDEKIRHMGVNVRTSGNLHFTGLIKTIDAHSSYGVFRMEYSPLLDQIIDNVIKITIFPKISDAISYLKKHHGIGEPLIENVNVTPQELYAISKRFTPTPIVSRTIARPVSSRGDSKQVSRRGRTKPSRLSHKTRK